MDLQGDQDLPADRGPDGGAWMTPPSLYEKLKTLARQYRREPTEAEAALWKRIRKRQAGGVKFRRQHTVGQFIVDFYAPEIRLVVEVDGPVHDYSEEQDAIRQEFLECIGLRVLRFTNQQVLERPDSVLAAIAETIRQLTPSVR